MTRGSTAMTPGATRIPVAVGFWLRQYAVATTVIVAIKDLSFLGVLVTPKRYHIGIFLTWRM
jgi:hypothetical protein